MCGRYYIEISDDEIREIINEIEREKEKRGLSFQLKSGEIFPSDLVPVLALEDGIVQPRPMIWGFPKWGNQSGVIFNARSESVLEKKMFRDALIHHPVVVPTNGFFEWKSTPGERKKSKYLFRISEHETLYLAGFSNTFPNNHSTIAERFTILTTNANSSVAPYHNRMPIIVLDNELDVWLNGKNLDYFLNRTPVPVSAKKIDA